MGVRGITQIFLPLFAGAMSGSIKVGGDGGDSMPVRAVARRATAYINDPRPLRHEILGADLLRARIGSFIFRDLAGAADEKESGRADGQDLKTPS